MEEQLIRIGITHGDINGISYELLLKAFSDTRLLELCTPVIYGSSKVAAYHRKNLDLQALNMVAINKAEDASPGRLYIINCISDEVKVEIARPTEMAGEAARSALDVSVADLKRGAIDAIVTLPVSNQIILKKGYPIHGRYLEKNLSTSKGATLDMLIYGDIRFALFTGSIPLSTVASSITASALVGKLQLLDKSLRCDFGVVKPRIAVLSLNPRAGAGLENSEEESIIAPAISEAGEKHSILAFGPYPVDSFFGSRMYDSFDGIMAMYHDQIAGACKALYETDGVHYTAGLPAIHTAPAHGAAYDIAGQNKASEDSFRRAIYTAIDVFRNRIAYREATANPLRKHYFDKGGSDDSLDLTKDYDGDI
jgi:4-hydroxythreonine-4-phosphate dehydrogenase